MLIDLRKRVFLHTQRLSLEFHESYTSGRIISRQTSDLDAIRELLDAGINQLVQGVLYMVVHRASRCSSLDWASGLVLLVALRPAGRPHPLVPGALADRVPRSRASRRRRLIVQFVETMTGIRAVKAFRKEKRNEDEFGELVEDYRDVNARVIQLFGIFDPGLVLIGNVTVAVVLLVGRLPRRRRQLAIGALLAALLYTRRFFDPMEEMAMFYNSYQSAAAALEKISGVLEEQPERARPDQAGRPVEGERRTCASTTCSSPTQTDRVILPRLRPRRSRPGRPSRWSARPVRASRRWPS